LPVAYTLSVEPRCRRSRRSVLSHLWNGLAGSEDAAHLRTEQTTTLQQQGRLWTNLDTFHQTALACAAAVAAEAEIADRDLLRRRAETDQAAAAAGLRDLASVLARPGSEAATETPLADPLLAACRIVGAAQGISFRAPKRSSNAPDPLGEIARASRVRLRHVALRGDWWRAESGPLLTYMRDDRCPVALIPTRRGGYEIVDVVAGTRGRLTEESAADLAAEAYAFYRPFPDGPVRSGDCYASA
jgi:ATP-binding cassette subfamily C protein